MGFARKRVGKDGKVRYTAAYRDLRGSIRSAGTFTSERAANQAWQKAEVELRQGRVGDPARGRQTLRKYVEEHWLPNHVIEPTTREKYAYCLSAHIFPLLGPMRMADVFPEHIREWITWMQREGRSAWTIQYCKSSILNSVFTSRAVIFGAACRGCPLRARCTTAKDGRTLHLHPHDPILRAARASWAAQPAVREDYRRYRPNVERVISQVASRGGRRLKLRYLGTAKNNAWLKNRTAALNLRNLINRGLGHRNGAWMLA